MDVVLNAFFPSVVFLDVWRVLTNWKVGLNILNVGVVLLNVWLGCNKLFKQLRSFLGNNLLVQTLFNESSHIWH